MNQYEHLKFPFPIKQQVYWGEMDAFNHINNVVYFRYFETGRIEFFNHSGLWELFIEDNIRIVVGKLECNFLKEIIHPAEIEIAVGLVKVGNSSLTVLQKISVDNEVRAYGEAIIVATSPETGKSMPWTDKLRTAFQQWL